MTWRELFAWRPKWWIDLAARFRTTMDTDSESSSSEPPHPRSSAERERFWAEFRAGQREADLRVTESRKPLVPCREDGTPK
jgi:hypothetical protein